MLRRRKKAADIVKELDTFTKTSTRTPEELVEKSGIGGALTLLASCLVIWLFTSEVYTFIFQKSLKFSFSPDIDLNEKLRLNIDITVAIPCYNIGADVVDSTDEGLIDPEAFRERDVRWELTPEARDRLEQTRMLNTYLSEEYHAVQKLLYQSSYRTFVQGLGSEDNSAALPVGAMPDACNIKGSVTINKVSGNVHVTSGKVLGVPGGHIHFSLGSALRANFSHRIQHFSFGTASAGVVHPLDGEEKITHESAQLFQYIIEVVPVDIDTGLVGSTTSYQLSIKEQARLIDHEAGSHGVPGIFFKYTMSPVRVKVVSAEQSTLAFFVSLFSTIAGIAVSCGIARDALGWMVRKINSFHEMTSEKI